MSEQSEPLQAPTPSSSTSLRELERQSFAIAFEHLLEKVAEGTTLTTFATEYHTPMSPGRFRTWIFANNNRKAAYMAAKAVGAEHVEDEMRRIADGLNADGTPSLNDTARSTLQVNTRKWILQVWNRKRYGDVKHIEQTTTTSVDLSRLSTDDLRQRLLEQMGLSSASSDPFAGISEVDLMEDDEA